MNEQKIKILLAMTNMNTGGIATAIRNMIHALPGDRFQIDLLVFNDDNCEDLLINGELKTAGKYMRLVSISQSRSFKENLCLGLYRLLLGGITKILGHKIAYAELLRHTSSLKKEYDIAISCTQSGPIRSLYGGCNEFVLAKVKAKEKISFIHCDYKTYGLDSKYSHEIYSLFDKIACVSESVKRGFLECEPSFSDKTYVSINFHNYEKIQLLASESPVVYDDDKFHFATVARLGNEKGHTRMLPIINELKEKGYAFTWHIIGGDLTNAPTEFVQAFHKYKLDEQIVFHGNQNNPYRFIKNVNLLLIPSYHEAAPMVYAEAHCLGVPILTTKTLSAVEMVENEEIGIVCDNNDISIRDALESILLDPSILSKYSVMSKQPDNKKAYDEFYKLIECEM